MSGVAPPPHRRAPQTTVGGRYSLVRRIAVGGMGEVWEAVDTVLGRPVAVKMLRDDLVGSPAFLQRFRAEARHTASLAHPAIASVFDYGEEGEGSRHVAYLVMELVPGIPLSRVIAEHGAVPVTMALSLLAQAADALHAAHLQGIVHRDVKPGNLLVLDDGTLKITDFGIARATNSAALTQVGEVIGTATYISPEQATGGEATPASDVYSLAIVGYEMLAGEPPFTADNVGALTMAHVHQPVPPLPSTIPTAVATAIAGALSKDPADRPADAHAFATNLRRLQMASMPPPGKSDEVWRNAGPTPAADHTETMAATAMMGAATSSRTAVMPAGRIVGAHGDLGVFEQAHAGRHQRRWVGLFAIAIAALVAVIALAQATNGGPDPVIGATTPQNSTTTVVTTVAPATTVVVNNPAPTPQTTVAKHGKKDEKKEKGGGKNG